jgi:hydrogenase small subunit
MILSRREFLKICGASAAAIGLTTTDLGGLAKVLANPGGPTVLWLQGSACTGCSVSLLNRISADAPQTAADVLVNAVNLVYHPNLMASAGQSAAALAEQAYSKGGYILAVEGGVPTAFGGNACWAWNYNGVDVTFQQAVTDLASNAAKILCIGTCASWGGMAAAGPNPTRIRGVKDATGKTTINIAGCPPHPDWIVWAVAQLLLGNDIALDSNGRPQDLYNLTVHDCCYRNGTTSGGFGIDGLCLKEIGCRGPETLAGCPISRWNNGANWCVEANHPCLGCTEPGFPGATPLPGSGALTPHEDSEEND